MFIKTKLTHLINYYIFAIYEYVFLTRIFQTARSYCFEYILYENFNEN